MQIEYSHSLDIFQKGICQNWNSSDILHGLTHSLNCCLDLLGKDTFSFLFFISPFYILHFVCITYMPIYILYSEGSPFINQEYILHDLTNTLNICLDLTGKNTFSFHLSFLYFLLVCLTYMPIYFIYRG